MRLTESKVYIGVSGYLATQEGQLLPKKGGGEKEIFVPCSYRVISDFQSFVSCAVKLKLNLFDYFNCRRNTMKSTG